MAEWIAEQLDEMLTLARRVREDEELLAALERICAMVTECLERGGKILTMGNGGSAADALHLAEEMTGRYRGNRRPFPAICLAADGPALTCIGNDFGFEEIFARQVEAFCGADDVVIAFSTSGNSENILRALNRTREKGGRTIGILGRDGGKTLTLCDMAFIVPAQDSARIQELHGFALHVICEAVERKFGERI